MNRAGPRILELATRVARWDVSSTLAEVAHRYDYCRPQVADDHRLEIEEGRHPVVERLAAAGRFVPNDCRLDAGAQRLWLITGPNMAGKSTFLRQVAHQVILAQMGSFVPAKSAHVGIVDRLLSRVGASDNLARGDSTFMVEMKETSRILRHATHRSFVILDEIGRGTSTLDGLAIAWAVTEYLDQVVRCRALFATHFHELTDLSEQSPHIANFSVSAQEIGQDVVFMHRLGPGPTNRSFGVAVAKLAGLPAPVLARAAAVLTELERGVSPGAGVSLGKPDQQLDLFHTKPAPSPNEKLLLDELRALDLDRLTPMESLNLLVQWKSRLGQGGQ